MFVHIINNNPRNLRIAQLMLKECLLNTSAVWRKDYVIHNFTNVKYMFNNNSLCPYHFKGRRSFKQSRKKSKNCFRLCILRIEPAV